MNLFSVLYDIYLFFFKNNASTKLDWRNYVLWLRLCGKTAPQGANQITSFLCRRTGLLGDTLKHMPLERLEVGTLVVCFTLVICFYIFNSYFIYIYLDLFI
jgi:hypothetical protein